MTENLFPPTTDTTKIDWVGVSLVSLFFAFLTYAGYLSYKSIDWDVLKRIENQQLVLPTPILPKQPPEITAVPTPAN
ncbi:MAG: hypothetical protein WC686_03285 [Candidatus Shapirobacteria bacterium]|jgi:hypothetical protein